jgi:hypothetical protein
MAPIHERYFLLLFRAFGVRRLLIHNKLST